jgi:hypothetical protein
MLCERLATAQEVALRSRIAEPSINGCANVSYVSRFAFRFCTLAFSTTILALGRTTNLLAIGMECRSGSASGKGLTSSEIDLHQRARRDSNPQLPDRQSQRGARNRRVNIADSETTPEKATKNATTAESGEEMTSDDMLLQVIEAWASLTPARRRMIAAIVVQSR